jgi:O-antigen ligase
MSLLYLLLFVTPFHNDPRLGTVLWDAGGMMITPIKLLGLLTAAVALLAPVPQNAAPRLPSPLVALFLPFAIVPVVATIGYGLPAPVTGAIGQLVSSALLFVAIIPLVRTKERMFKATRTLVIGFAVGSLWVYKQHFLEHALSSWGQEGESNYEALMLLLSLPLAFWMARYEERRWWRRIGLTCSLLLACAIPLTASRAGVATEGIVGLALVVKSRHKLAGMLGLVLAALLLFAFAPHELSHKFESIQFTGKPINGDAGSTRIHLEMDKAGLRMMEAHPIFGVGLGQFKAVAPEYNPEILKLAGRSWIAHNTFIQVGSEAGIPALLLFLAMLGVAYRNFRAARRSSDERLAALGLFMEASLIGICIAALTTSVEFLPFCMIIILSQSLREIAAATGEHAEYSQAVKAANAIDYVNWGARATVCK